MRLPSLALVILAWLVPAALSATPSAPAAPRPAAGPSSRPRRPTPPTRDPHTPGYVTATELPDGALPSPSAVRRRGVDPCSETPSGTGAEQNPSPCDKRDSGHSGLRLAIRSLGRARLCWVNPGKGTYRDIGFSITYCYI